MLSNRKWRRKLQQLKKKRKQFRTTMHQMKKIPSQQRRLPKNVADPREQPTKPLGRSTVVEEPVAQAEPEPKPVAEPPPEAKSKPKKAEVKPKVQAPVDTPAPAPEEPPPSPRTMMREAARHILQLQTLREATRKSHLTDTYTKKLHSL